MEFISVSWLFKLGLASAWTIFFSMFNAPGIRGWRNLGWLACFVLGAVMAFVMPWRVSLATWAAAGVFSGLVYFVYELLAYVKAKDKSTAAKPNLGVLFHGLFLWPIMLPEAIEYALAELGVLKAPDAKA